MDRFEAMRAYVHVVDSGSYTRAARQLNVHKATVSQHIQQLEQANAEQQQAVDALHKNIAELHQANAELTARCQAYEKSLEGVLSSSSWRITSPFRRLLGWFHRSR